MDELPRVVCLHDDAEGKLALHAGTYAYRPGGLVVIEDVPGYSAAICLRGIVARGRRDDQRAIKGLTPVRCGGEAIVQGNAGTRSRREPLLVLQAACAVIAIGDPIVHPKLRFRIQAVSDPQPRPKLRPVNVPSRAMA